MMLAKNVQRMRGRTNITDSSYVFVLRLRAIPSLLLSSLVGPAVNYYIILVVALA